ncbi:hypothetical protein HNR30_008915 [Nonomuraea soli]|uniref:Uncharacterized protein n=1 Tax=Nonomuraea soli TaxID=1032476 RepID=A0A7W0HVX2_9ACTN|nr:hypothetical protein [Nonomuraea soli]
MISVTPANMSAAASGVGLKDLMARTSHDNLRPR